MTKTACVFPGQGSQSVMLKELAETSPIIEATFKGPLALGYDLDLVQNDTDGKLNETITQPALLAASVAIWRVIHEQGIDKITRAQPW